MIGYTLFQLVCSHNTFMVCGRISPHFMTLILCKVGSYIDKCSVFVAIFKSGLLRVVHTNSMDRFYGLFPVP